MLFIFCFIKNSIIFAYQNQIKMDLKQKLDVLEKAYKLKFIAEYLDVTPTTVTYKKKDVGKFTYSEVLKIESLYQAFIASTTNK